MKQISKIWLLIIIFLLPVVFAGGLYLLRDHLHISSKTQGLLLNPPLALENLQLNTLENTAVAADFFAKHWWLIYVAPAHCTDECALQLAKLRSVYFALTKNMPRVKRLFLVQENSLNITQLSQIKKDKPLVIEKIANPDYLLNACGANKEGLFIMDPLGNIMLCYAPQQEAHAILQDIEKLLKTSRIG